MKTINEAAAWLQARNDFLIITHRRPDGDATGCALALCLGLRSIGKTAWIWANPQFTPRYAARLAGLTTETVSETATVISVDMASETLLPINGSDFAGKILLSLDHHPSNPGYATETLKAAIKTLFDMGYSTVKTGAFEINLPSQRVMEKAGMTKLSDTECIDYRGVRHKCIMFEARKVLFC